MCCFQSGLAGPWVVQGGGSVSFRDEKGQKARLQKHTRGFGVGVKTERFPWRDDLSILDPSLLLNRSERDVIPHPL